MDNAERIVALETKVKEIDGAIRDIRDEQEAARLRDTERQVDMGKLTVQLEGFIAALKDHTQWHKDHTGNRFSISNIVVSVCALLVLVADFLVRLPG